MEIGRRRASTYRADVSAWRHIEPYERRLTPRSRPGGVHGDGVRLLFAVLPHRRYWSTLHQNQTILFHAPHLLTNQLTHVRNRTGSLLSLVGFPHI